MLSRLFCLSRGSPVCLTSRMMLTRAKGDAKAIASHVGGGPKGPRGHEQRIQRIRLCREAQAAVTAMRQKKAASEEPQEKKSPRARSAKTKKAANSGKAAEAKTLRARLMNSGGETFGNGRESSLSSQRDFQQKATAQGMAAYADACR